MGNNNWNTTERQILNFGQKQQARKPQSHACSKLCQPIGQMAEWLTCVECDWGRENYDILTLNHEDSPQCIQIDFLENLKQYLENL